jgi:lipoate-protein ligase B
MKLQHLRLPNLTRYQHASHLQDILVRRQLAHKAAPTTTSAPLPVLITAQFHPVYTAGRREAGTLSAADEEYLRRGGAADFFYTQRGGQTTFHGPGQLVAYPVIDLRRHGITPRCYVHMLEQVLIATCGAYGVPAMRTENTGVWTTPDRKIAAIGVHLRRFVTSHGIALNVSTDLDWFNRIVACGLEDKGATTLAAEGVEDVSVKDVEKVFVDELAKHLKGIDGVDEITEDLV